MVEGDVGFVTEAVHAFLKYGEENLETDADGAVCRSRVSYPWSGFLQKLDEWRKAR